MLISWSSVFFFNLSLSALTFLALSPSQQMYLKSTLQPPSTPSRMLLSVCPSSPVMRPSQTPVWKPFASSDTAPNTFQTDLRSAVGLGTIISIIKHRNITLCNRTVAIWCLFTLILEQKMKPMSYFYFRPSKITPVMT